MKYRRTFFLSAAGRIGGKTFCAIIDFVKLYGEHMEEFKRICQQMDPEGVFLNDFYPAGVWAGSKLTQMQRWNYLRAEV